MTEPNQGRISRVNGPLVEATALPGVAISEVLRLGQQDLLAEVVAISEATVTMQAYEYTGGLAPGHRVTTTGEALSARLGPWLLGGIFDGLLRPLAGRGRWLLPGTSAPRDARTWVFTPTVVEGQSVEGGAVLGTLTGTGPVLHKVLVPPEINGAIEWLAPPGDVDADDPVARVGSFPVTVGLQWPVRVPRPFRARQSATDPLLTGQRSLDLLGPIARGSTAAVPGGFGTGKTMMLQQIAKWCDADVIVYVGCGERGNEMTDVVADFSTLTDPRTGGRLAERTVVIANTSNMPVMAREASVYAGVTVAEYYRDMGYAAVVIADSTSRWAEALRELSSRNAELPAEEGFPATLNSALASFYERAGSVETLAGTTGSVTIVGAVSPPSGDMTEPVTSHTQQLVRCLWTLDRDLAYARHYPAVSWSASYSRDAAGLGLWYARNGDPHWARRRERIVALLSEADRLTALADLIGRTALASRERVVLLSARLLSDGVLQQNALNDNDAPCTRAKAIALADALLEVTDRCQAAVQAGADAATAEGVDFSPLLRAREDIGPDDVAGVRDRLAVVLNRIETSTS